MEMQAETSMILFLVIKKYCVGLIERSLHQAEESIGSQVYILVIVLIYNIL